MATQRKPSGAKPTHRLYSVIGEGKNARWTEIGAAWPHRDGEGFSLTYTAIPLNGQIVMRPITDRNDEQEAE